MDMRNPVLIRAIFFEPETNIRAYKGRLSVLPDEVRAELLRHIPGIHYVVRVPDWGQKTPKEFWSCLNVRMNTYARQIREIVELSDPLAKPKICCWPADQRKRAIQPNLQILYDRNRNNEFTMRAGDWEKQTKGFEMFSQLASQYLTDK